MSKYRISFTIHDDLAVCITTYLVGLMATVLYYSAFSFWYGLGSGAKLFACLPWLFLAFLWVSTPCPSGLGRGRAGGGARARRLGADRT